MKKGSSKDQPPGFGDVTQLDVWDPEANPFLAALLGGMKSAGARVASIEAETETLTGVKPRLSYGSDVRVLVSGPLGTGSLTLQELLDHGDPAAVTDIRAPNRNWQWWQVLALSAGREPMLVALAHETPGLGSLLLSRALTPQAPPGRSAAVPIGDALTDALTRSKLVGVRRRIENARATLAHPDAIRGIAASAVSEYLASPSIADAGFKTHDFWIGELERMPERVGVTPAAPRRRAGLQAAILKALEADAFGVGIDSPRGRRRPLRVRASEELASPSTVSKNELDAGSAKLWHAATGAAAALTDFLQGIEARLDGDERALWAQWQADPAASDSELRRRLGWKQRRLGQVRRQLKKKAREGPGSR